MSRMLSTAEVARVLGVREARIRELVRWGLCRPTRRGRGYAFDFQDLVVLRTAVGLLEQHVPASRVRGALSSLSAQLPPERPLSGMRVFADGRHVAVRDGAGTWQPETGQALLDFEVDALAAEAERARGDRGGVPADDAARARSEFEAALELEAEAPDAAAAAYRRSVALDPLLVEAWVNLGRLAHEAGDAREAAHLYHRALELSSEDPVIHFNLALALEDSRGPGPAASHYERAIALDADFADAHYNLAGLYEQLGREADALRHYHAYKKLTDG